MSSDTFRLKYVQICKIGITNKNLWNTYNEDINSCIGEDQEEYPDTMAQRLKDGKVFEKDWHKTRLVAIDAVTTVILFYLLDDNKDASDKELVKFAKRWFVYISISIHPDMQNTNKLRAKAKEAFSKTKIAIQQLLEKILRIRYYDSE